MSSSPSRLFRALAPLLLSTMTAACASTAAPSQTPDGSSSSPSALDAPGRQDADHSNANPNTPPTTVSLFVVHRISDVSAFRSYFKKSIEGREEAGVVGYLLSQVEETAPPESDSSNPSSAKETRIVIHFIAESMEKVDAYLNSAAMNQLLETSGSPDSTLLWKTTDQLLDIPDPLPDSGTFSLFSKFKVDDPHTWRAQFDAIHSQLQDANIIATGIHLSLSNPQVIILHLVSNDRIKLHALIQDPRLSPILFAGPQGVPEHPLIAKDLMHQAKNND